MLDLVKRKWRAHPMSRIALVLVLILVGLDVASTVHAATGTDIIRALQSGDAYITPGVIQDHHASAGDTPRLESAARDANAQGAPEKLLIVRSFPRTYPDAASAASGVRSALNFDGTLILVAEPGVAGISSSTLSAGERSAILRKAEAPCITQSYTACAVAIGSDAASRARNRQASSAPMRSLSPAEATPRA